MRAVTSALILLFIFVLSACEKADYEKKAEKDADVRRAINTAPK